MPGSLCIDFHTAAIPQCGQQLARPFQSRRTASQRLVRQTLITRLVIGKAYSLHQRCSCAFHSSQTQKQNNHQGMRIDLCWKSMHFTSTAFCLHRFSTHLSARIQSARGAAKLSVLLGIYSRSVWQKQRCFPTERGASSLEQFTGPVSILEATHNAGHLHQHMLSIPAGHGALSYGSWSTYTLPVASYQ